MKRWSWMVASLVAVAATGCKKESGGSTRGAAAKVPAAFAAWDMPARQAAWQGAWAGEGEALGDKAAWQITGDQITFINAKGERKLKLVVESPCSAGFVEVGADGSRSSTTHAFTLQNGQLVTGLGDAGSRKGDKAVVCGGGEIFTLDGATCLMWESMFDKLESKPGKCGFRQDAGKEVFFYEAHGHESVIEVAGDVIWSEQLRTVHATKHPDLAAAKAAQGL